METLIMHPKNKEQLLALKAIAKALKIAVETQKSPYNPDFVAMVKDAEKRGNYKTIDVADIWGSLNSK
jgi:nitrate reductase assembly molybdenum cofactor insertion protein NarJ